MELQKSVTFIHQFDLLFVFFGNVGIIESEGGQLLRLVHLIVDLRHCVETLNFTKRWRKLRNIFAWKWKSNKIHITTNCKQFFFRKYIPRFHVFEGLFIGHHMFWNHTHTIRRIAFIKLIRKCIWGLVTKERILRKEEHVCFCVARHHHSSDWYWPLICLMHFLQMQSYPMFKTSHHVSK